MIERFDHFAIHKPVQVAQIRNHSGGRIDRAGNRDFDDVVVSVSIRIVALAIDALIFFIAELRAVQAM
jgi:hypothetical protein